MADPVTWLAIASTTMSAVGSYQTGRAQADMANYEAQQIDANAERVAQDGIRRAEELRRQKRIALSDARAEQAAGGGTTTDAGALGQLGRIGGIFEYNALEELYGSGQDAMGLSRQAGGRRVEGNIAKRAGTMTALSTILSGASSIYGARAGKPAGSEYTRPTRLPPGTRPPAIRRY